MDAATHHGMVLGWETSWGLTSHIATSAMGWPQARQPCFVGGDRRTWKKPGPYFATAHGWPLCFSVVTAPSMLQGVLTALVLPMTPPHRSSFAPHCAEQVNSPSGRVGQDTRGFSGTNCTSLSFYSHISMWKTEPCSYTWPHQPVACILEDDQIGSVSGPWRRAPRHLSKHLERKKIMKYFSSTPIKTSSNIFWDLPYLFSPPSRQI